MTPSVKTRWHHKLLVPATLSVVSLLSACDRPATAPNGRASTQVGSRAVVPAATKLRGIQGRFQEIAAEQPGFAGVALDSANTTAYLYMSTSANADAARSLVTAVLTDLGRANPGRFRGQRPAIQIVPVKYDFSQLATWRQFAVTLASDRAITSWGISERSNKVYVRVGDAGAVAHVASLLDSAGIPADARMIEIQGRAVVTGSLTSHYDGAFGGLRIVNSNGEGCSIGFNAYNSSGTRVFVTADHCTTIPAHPDSGSFYQPSSSFSAIGYELSDPQGIPPGGGCPTGYTCRWSDAATIAYNSGQNWRWSYLAKTSGTTVTDYEPIDSEQDSTISGESVARMGATSGYAVGTVINVNTGVEEQDASGNSLNIVIEGSVEVNTGASLGDSGGPVYVNPSVYSPPGIATLVGIEFGSNYPTSTVFYYSPLENIYSDLGFLTVFGTTVKITGNAAITTPGSYTWTANPLGGSSYSYAWEESDDGGSSWHGVGTNSSTFNQVWVTIPSFPYQFKLRVTATSSGSGYGLSGISEPFDVTVHS